MLLSKIECEFNSSLFEVIMVFEQYPQFLTSWTLTVELHMEMLLHVNKGKTASILLFSYVFELCMRRNLAVALRDERCNLEMLFTN